MLLLGISPLSLNAHRSLSFLVFSKQRDTKHSDFSLLRCLSWIVFFVKFHLHVLWVQQKQTYLRMSYGQLDCTQHSSASERSIVLPMQHGMAPNHCCREAEDFTDVTPFHLYRWHHIAPQTSQRLRASLQDAMLQSTDVAIAERGSKHVSGEVVFSIGLTWQQRGEHSSDMAEITGPFPHVLYSMHAVILLLHSSTPTAGLHAAVIHTQASGST